MIYGMQDLWRWHTNWNWYEPGETNNSVEQQQKPVNEREKTVNWETSKGKKLDKSTKQNNNKTMRKKNNNIKKKHKEQKKAEDVNIE